MRAGHRTLDAFLFSFHSFTERLSASRFPHTAKCSHHDYFWPKRSKLNHILERNRAANAEKLIFAQTKENTIIQLNFLMVTPLVKRGAYTSEHYLPLYENEDRLLGDEISAVLRRARARVRGAIRVCVRVPCLCAADSLASVGRSLALFVRLIEMQWQNEGCFGRVGAAASAHVPNRKQNIATRSQRVSRCR